MVTVSKTKAKPAPATETKADQVVRLMSRASGATPEEMMAEMPMQIHSLRALISTVKKARKLKVHFDSETKRYKVLGE